MTRTSRVPTPRSRLADHDEQIYDLYRRLRNKGRPVKAEERIFSLSSTLTASTSPPDETKDGQFLYEVLCLLGTAGSSSTVVTVYKNAASVGTVTLASSATRKQQSFAVGWAPYSDILTVGVTTVGTGAKDLTVKCRFA